MNVIRKKTVAIFIILLLVLFATLLIYKIGFGRTGEWLTVNLFTISTKAKQEKYLEFADGYLAEIISHPSEKAVSGYEFNLEHARDFAEKIIFLDGAEIGLAAKFEEMTRIEEQVLAKLLLGANSEDRAIINEAISLTRVENRYMFAYMVEKYQLNNADISRDQKIVEAHLTLVERAVQNYRDILGDGKVLKIGGLLIEARKYQAAGLNLEAYDSLDKAKNIIYAKF